MLNTHEPISKDDNDWLAILSGRSVPDANPETLREARVLRMVLLARQEEETEKEFAKTDDQQWQRLENKLTKEGYIKPESWVKKLVKQVKVLVSTIANTSNQVTEVLTWQKLSFAAAYTVLVSVVTLTLFLPTKPVEMHPKSGGPDGGQDQKQIHRVISYPVTDPQQSVLELQAEFIAGGTDKKDVAIKELKPQQWMVAIQIAKTPSRNLREVYKNYQIDPENNQLVLFIVEPE